MSKIVSRENDLEKIQCPIANIKIEQQIKKVTEKIKRKKSKKIKMLKELPK